MIEKIVPFFSRVIYRILSERVQKHIDNIYLWKTCLNVLSLIGELVLWNEVPLTMENFLSPFTVVNLSNASIRLICLRLIKIRFLCRLIYLFASELVNIDAVDSNILWKV